MSSSTKKIAGRSGGGGGGGGKLMPHLDEQSTKILNLTVLQRIDPYIEEILSTAGHVSLYEFNTDLQEWSRKDVEGSLFVVKRNGQPRFQYIVMNRRNTGNLVEDLLGDLEYEIQVPYLLYRNSAQEVNGIWFYNSDECEEIGTLFTRILGAYSKVPLKSTPSAPLIPRHDDLMVPNLLKPSTFFALAAQPISSVTSRGSPLLQPFPPPTPPPLSLTVNPSVTSLLSREKIRKALLMLVQDDRFVDLFCEALLKVDQC